MYITCEKCGRTYNDEFKWTICPHRHLGERPTDGEPEPELQGPPEQIGTGVYRMVDGEVVGNEADSPER